MSESQPNESAANKCDPVCQLFINLDGKLSRYTFTNFASCYAPDRAAPLVYSVRLHDETGAEVANQQVAVPPFGTVEFIPTEVFSDRLLPQLGLISVELIGAEHFWYEPFGMLRPYFYALYHDARMRSLALVHPQTTFLQNAPAAQAWRSAQVVRTREVDSLEFYQVNPMPEARETSISVCDLAGTALVTSTATMPSHGVRRVRWRADEFRTADFICLGATALTAPNAKPLVFQYRGESFTGGHS